MQVSFGSVLTPIGVFFLTYGFGAFFQILPGADIAAILLIYGFPITLLGFALSYAQLKPVPCKTTKEALALRDAQATDIQKQVQASSSGYLGDLYTQSTCPVTSVALLSESLPALTSTPDVHRNPHSLYLNSLLRIASRLC